MASQLGSLFTPGYDSTMQGLIGDENADQARGQQAMGQMQNQQLAQQELQQREANSLRDYELAKQGMAATQQENEMSRLHDLARDKTGFEQGLKLQEVAAGNVSKSNIQQNDFQVGQIKLAKEYENAKYKQQQKDALQLSLIQQKVEEAKLNGDFESAKNLSTEELALRKKMSQDAFALGVATQLQGKSRSDIQKTMGLFGQKLADIKRNYEASQGRAQSAVSQNIGRIYADRREQAVQKVKEFNAQRDAELYRTPALRAISPNLEGLEQIDGIQFLKFNPAENVGGSIKALNPFRATSDYGFGEEMNADEMNTFISEHIATSTLDLIDQMGIQGIDKVAGAEAIRAALQGRPEAEVIALTQKAKIDPVMFKAMSDQLARISEGEGIGGDLKRAREQEKAAELASAGQDTVQLRAARANVKAIKTYGALYRKMARSFTNVTDLPAIESMLEAVNAADKSGKYEGLVDTRMAEMGRLMPDNPDLLKDLAASRAGELKSLTDISQLGTTQVENQGRLSELETRKSRSKLEGDRKGAAVAKSELERLLMENQ